MNTRKFFSKILLFGEYTIILDSKALSIPYDTFSGELGFKIGGTVEASEELRNFALYMTELLKNGPHQFDFDTSLFEYDIEQGLFFNSSIPVGHGLGSSGALCAALYDRYTKNKIESTDKSGDLLKLKKIFALMESHFHGSSSGIDPLISYVNGPILMENKQSLIPVTIPSFRDGAGALFLINTNRPRRTEPLVNLFLEKLKHREFSDFCNSKLIPTTNRCIVNFLEGDIGELLIGFKELSSYQYDHFSPMIPKLFHKTWRRGLDTDSFYLKLCGAGGGGVFLGITDNFDQASSIIGPSKVKPLYRFSV